MSLFIRNIRITINLDTPAQSVTNEAGVATGGTAETRIQQLALADQQIVLVGTGTGNDFTMEVVITKVAGLTYNSANVLIKGLDHDIAAVMSHINFFPLQVLYNVIKIEAGYNGVYTTVFIGNITNARPDYNDPNTSFIITAQSSYFSGIIESPSYSISGTVPVSTMINTIAAQAPGDLSVQAYGIDDLIANNPVYTGGVTKQLQDIGNDYGLNVKEDNGIVYVSPLNQSLVNNSDIPTVSTDNIMLGYPILQQSGVDVRVMMSSQVQFGHKILIDSIVPLTSGQWIIVGAIYTLKNRGDKFEILLQCNRFGFLNAGT